MTDVRDDKYWNEAADFVKNTGGAAPQETIAPREFDQLLPGIVGYEQRQTCSSPRTVIIHKGLVPELQREWLQQVTRELYPAFANEVFVVFTAKRPAHRAGHPTHFAAFVQQLKTLDDRRRESSGQRSRSWPSRLRHWLRPRGRGVPVVTEARPAVYLGGGRALTRTIHGHKMYVHTSDLSLAPSLLLNGLWEQEVSIVLQQILRRDMIVVEVGANIGFHSVFAADYIGPKGRLFAFEPNPLCADLCRLNLEINGFTGRSTVVTKGVYSRSERLRFKAFERYAGGSSLYATPAAAEQLRDTLHEIEIEAVSLDEYFLPGQKIDLLKVDAEGAEPLILRGARRLLTDNPNVVLILEYSPQILEGAHGSTDIFWDEIEALKFKAFEITMAGLVPVASELTLEHCDLLLRRE